jgi:cell division protein FtsZ
VIDETMEDRLRVTMVATGLGSGASKARQPRLEVVEHIVERTGTDGLGTTAESVDYDRLERTPAVIRRGRTQPSPAGAAAGFDPSDIPAFLRKQAD